MVMMWTSLSKVSVSESLKNSNTVAATSRSVVEVVSKLRRPNMKTENLRPGKNVQEAVLSETQIRVIKLFK